MNKGWKRSGLACMNVLNSEARDNKICALRNEM